jgi:hypothetical protein
MRRIIFVGLVLVGGCGARTPISQSGLSLECPSTPPVCIQRSEDPCGARAIVQAECSDHAWSCPLGARVYARVAAPATCLPMTDPSTGVSTVGDWGLSSIVRIPTDDGRCLWIAEDVKFSDGTEHRNVPFEPDLDAPFGTCPTKSRSTPAPIVTMEGGDDPSILVQLTGGYRLGGKTHVIYRLFRVDATSAFGVTEMGGGVAHWDPKTERIVVPSPKNPFPWGLDLDLGDAMMLSPDGSHALVWGCAKNAPDLVEGCALAELDANDVVTLRSEPQFSSGPWVSSVVANAGRFEHVYIAGFGSTLESDVAASPIGPWSKGPTLARCQTPSADAKSYCAGPVVHPELTDPTHSGERVVTYSIGSTGPHTGKAADYWPHLVWLR